MKRGFVALILCLIVNLLLAQGLGKDSLTFVNQELIDSILIDKDSILTIDSDSPDSVFMHPDQVNESVIDTLINKPNDSIPEFIEKFPELVDSISDIIPDTLLVTDDSLQTIKSDTVRIDSIHSDNLSIEIPLDSLRLDTTKIVDTISYVERDITIHSSQAVKDSVLKHLADSLYFTRIDTGFFHSKHYHSFIRNDTSVMVNDTVQQAIDVVYQYLLNQNVNEAVDYLSLWIQNLEKKRDSVNSNYIDSLFNAVDFLFHQFEEDTFEVCLFNSQNDSIHFVLGKDDLDSIRLDIYDFRNESAPLWVKKVDKNRLSLELEPGAMIQKPKRQRGVARRVDTEELRIGLKEMRKLDIIVPIWEYSFTTDILFNQGYVDNWVEGGESSISGLSISRFDLDYTYGKRSWTADVEYRYGLLKTGEAALRKNDDKLEINSTFNQEAFDNWNYTLLLNFKTQLFKGYNYPNDSVPVSAFLAPGYLVFSLGLDYKPIKGFNLLVSPITSKFTMVRDTAKYDQTSYGLLKNERTRKEIGAYIKTNYIVNLRENISLENRANFFINYTQNPQNIDVDWEVILKFKITDYLTASINTHLIYDDDVDIPVIDKNTGQKIGTTKNLQFKEMLNIGFTLRF